MPSTVVATWTKVIVDYASSRGCELSPPGIDLARHDQRVPAQLDDVIWEAAHHLLGDADLGIHVAESAVTTASFGVVGFLARSSTTVLSALQRAHRYHRLITDRGRMDLVISDRSATLTEAPERGRGRWPRPVAELVLANYVHQARCWTGLPIVPVAVRFQHAKPRNTTELERFFGIPPVFEQAENALVLSRDTLELRLATAEPTLGEFLEASAIERLGKLPPPDVLDDVRATILDQLRAGHGDVRLDEVARRLSASPRSLQRRLQSNATSYRELVDAIRHEQTLELQARAVPPATIAERLGFSHPRAFRRALRRWTRDSRTGRRGDA